MATVYTIPGENCSRMLLLVVELSTSLEAKLLLVADCTLPQSSCTVNQLTAGPLLYTIYTLAEYIYGELGIKYQVS